MRAMMGWSLGAVLAMGCGQPCEEGGQTHAAGSSWECADGCNTCTCTAGEVVSTRLACLDPCDECLAGGGTWQPEADECTKDCALQDISCFDETCPGTCEEDCANCFSATDCEARACTWTMKAEAGWCTP